MFEKTGIGWTYIDMPQIINGIDSYDSDITWCVGDSGYVAVNQNPDLLSIEQHDPTFEFDIYPNPVTDVLKYKWSSVTDINSVTIHDMNGKVHYFANQIESDIDVSRLPSGVYVISIQYNDTSISKHFVKTDE